MFDVLLDAFLDCIKILPIIFVVYVLIEFLESRESAKDRLAKIFSGRFSPFFGAAVGVIPQCGFSVVAARLFQEGFIATGTLLAVFLATSDEALPILFSKAVVDPKVFLSIGLIVAIKVVYAMAVGFLVNAFCKREEAMPVESAEIEDDDGCCHHHITGERATAKTLLLHPLLHSLKIILYIFLINLVFGVLIEFVVGEEALREFLSVSVWLQPLFSTFVGLIPNCASSVVITEMFAEGYLTFGAAIAGLAVNCGIATAVLIKDKKNIKRSLLVIGLLFLSAIALGYAVTAVSLVI